ncbi:MAG TPA: class I SAM-dependent methyltransferase [Candidatus Wujingus californicus]|uniref:class I SAM-dependent methyltransferase n=2 Tax=Candidatus Wujingus californicus TaxID=3367618 RepID=UPI004027617E
MEFVSMKLLEDFIIENIKKKGKITFADFMRMALYHPEYGYYNSDREQTGRFGDYYTSPTISKYFGELVAKQLEEMWKSMGEVNFTVVEMGSNTGWLCYDIMRFVRKEYPAFYDKFRYVIIESNAYKRKKQQILLDSINLPPEKVVWHTYSEDGFSFDGINGCFLANEFVDALPVHLLKVKKGILKELYVSYNENEFFEIEDNLSSHILLEYLETCKCDFKEGQVFEVNLDGVNWLRQVSKKLNRGFVLTIDYGCTKDNIYYEDDREGTLRCFYKHTVNHDFYKRVGEQDITASVDFTSLINSGRPFGLEFTGLTKQSQFLIALGILGKINTLENGPNAILKIKNLIHPEVMGDVFKVLIQHKNVTNTRLSGLKPLRLVEM